MHRRLKSAWVCFFVILGAFCSPCWAIVHQRMDIQIPMRDGRFLSADQYIPAETGSFPVILIYTPYGKESWAPVFTNSNIVEPLLKNSNYAFVVLEWRGTYSSSGAAYEGSPSLAQDGYDAVEWIAAQSWSSGNVGMWGASALGTAQMAVAAQQPPHLKGCVPMSYSWRTYYDVFYPGGVYQRNRNEFMQITFGGLSWIRQHPYYDAFWSYVESHSGSVSSINVPMLHISGWYDHQTESTLREMFRLQNEGGAAARGKQKLMIGPWTHHNIGRLEQGQLEYPAAEHAASMTSVEFFDYYLRDLSNGYPNQPVLRYFRMNDDEWRTGDRWPPLGTQTRTYYFAANGTLASAPPTVSDGGDTFLADPSDPVPTIFGALVTSEFGQQGPGDLREIEARPDVLTYTTTPMVDSLVIEGRPKVQVWIQSDTVDTDVVVRMTEVYPDGRSLLLVDSVRRASLRGSYSTPNDLSDGVAYEISVELPSVAVSIPQGHQLRILVGPSNFDRFDVNPQDGSSFSDDPEATLTTGTYRVLRDPTHPSRIEIPSVETIPVLCDNDGNCEPGEDCRNCPGDCASRLSGPFRRRFCCGDGVHVSAEGNGTVCDGNF